MTRRSPENVSLKYHKGHCHSPKMLSQISFDLTCDLPRSADQRGMEYFINKLSRTELTVFSRIIQGKETGTKLCFSGRSYKWSASLSTGMFYIISVVSPRKPFVAKAMDKLRPLDHDLGHARTYRILHFFRPIITYSEVPLVQLGRSLGSQRESVFGASWKTLKLKDGKFLDATAWLNSF